MDIVDDRDELIDLAMQADDRAGIRGEDADRAYAKGVYARGVRDTLIWLATGVQAEDLIDLFGGR